MAIKAYPLNNINYSAEDAMLQNLPIQSGVYAASGNLDPTITGNLTISYSVGLFFMRYDTAKGFTGYLNSPQTVTLSAADNSLPRIDRIVLRFTASTNAVTLSVKNGTPASNPVAPSRSATASVYELVLTDVYRAARSTHVSASDLTDQRENESLCGLMKNAQTPSMRGLSAYEQAVTGGYTGTLANFYNDLAAMDGLASDINSIAATLEGLN